MDQVYRSLRKFGTIILAMFMFVSIFDAQLIDAEGSSSSAKITHTCDEQNVQVYESNGELMIPWNSTIETATSDLVKYTSYEATMQEHVWSTPEGLKLLVQEENSGETKTLIEGTDFQLLYKMADNLYEADKEKVETFQGFKLLFQDKEKSFFKLTIHYNTFGKLSDLTEADENRNFITEDIWKVENDDFVSQEATYSYSNPNYKPVEQTQEAERGTKEFNWEDDEVTIKATVANGVLPDDAVLTAEKVDSNSNQFEEIVKQIEDAEQRNTYYYNVYFTANNKKVEIGEENVSVEITLKNQNMNILPVENGKVLTSMRSNMVLSANSTVSLNGFPNGYVIWTSDYETGIDHTSKYSFEDFGGQYNLFYIIGNYNVFTFDYYYGTHVVGPMIVGGEAAKQQSGSDNAAIDSEALLNIGGSTVPPYIEYAHKVPSYFKGKANINKTVITSSNVPLFLGNVNGVNQTRYTLQGPENSTYYNYYFDEGSKTYVNFDEAKAKIKGQMNTLAQFQGVDTNGRFVEISKITASALDEFEKEDSYVSADKSYSLCKSGEAKFKTVLKLKLGYNYVFEEGVFEKIDAIIYDYESLNEATQTTTFLNVKDSYDTLKMPYIFKSQCDELGDTSAIADLGAYQFASSEVEKGINIAYFMPNVKNIQIGFKRDIEGSTNDSNKDGLNKLVGHLIAPDANVDIRSGDYNGSIIANKVSSTAEGHMWPFKTDLSFEFNKTVDGKLPSSGEHFTFELSPKVVPTGATINVSKMTAQSDAKGNINFEMNLYTKEGTYIYEIKETNLDTSKYIDNDQVFYVKVKVVRNSSDVGYGQLTAKVVGYYTTFDNGDVVESSKINDTSPDTDQLTFKNQTKTKVEIEKKWLDSDGSILEIQYRKPVDIQLIRKETYIEGYQVRINVYYKDQLLGSEETKAIKEHGSMSITTKHSGSDWHYLNDVIVTGKAEVKNDTTKHTKCVQVSSKFNGSDIEIKNITSNIVVNIYYDCGDPSGAKLNLNDQISLGYSSENFNEEQKYGTSNVGKPVTLSDENKWSHVFDDLLTKEFKDGKSSVYTYSIKELGNLDDFNVSYDNNNGITEGKITVTNAMKPYELVIQKASVNGSTENMSGAEFVLKNNEGSYFEFEKADGTYQYKNSSVTETEKTTLVTDSDGLIKLTGLPYGEYQLIETKAPQGFIKEELPIEISVGRFGKDCYYRIGNETSINLSIDKTDTSKIVYGLTVENIPDIHMPEAGGNPSDMYQKLGFLIACCGLILFSFYECKRHKDIKKDKI